jgi:hypothetical protein
VQVYKGTTTQLIMGRSLVGSPSANEVPTFGTFLPSEFLPGGASVRAALQIKPDTITTPLANGAFKQIKWESWDKCGAVGKAVQEVTFNGKTVLIPGTLILDQPVPYNMVTNTMFYKLSDGRGEPNENPQSKWGFSYLYFVPDRNARAFGSCCKSRLLTTCGTTKRLNADSASGSLLRSAAIRWTDDRFANESVDFGAT